MHAELITIGDEILIGQVVDTNSTFIARELNKIGISVYQISSVQDERQHILQALEEASSRAQLVITTGGLGPTRDDITKNVFCEFLEDELTESAEVLSHIEALFKKHISTPISDLNRQQAQFPSRADILHNPYGTAPGLWMRKGETLYVALPGVPFEMKHLLTEVVIPRLVETFERPHIVHKTLMTYGLGESAIANRIAEWESALPPFIRLAYLPNLGKVRLRLTAKGADRQQLRDAVEIESRKLQSLLSDIIQGEEGDETIEAGIAALLTRNKLTLATAESFTGGRIASILTEMPGASVYFKGSVVSYATEIKTSVLQVSTDTVSRYSVVSEQVAIEMAANVRQLMKSHYAISTTGNAGPTKGDSDEEVGMVFIGIATPEKVYAHRFDMGNHRTRIIQKSVHKAFELLQKEIAKI